MKQLFYCAIFISTSLMVKQGFAYPTYEGCGDLKDSDFKLTTLVGFVTNDRDMWEPIEMTFDPVYDNQGKMHVNIYWVQRGHRTNTNHPGEIRFYDARTGTASTVGKLGKDFGSPVYLGDGTNENGVTGIALDPDFKENRFLYIYYSTLDSQSLRTDQIPAAFVVERYTATAQNTIDPASGKRLLTIPMFPQYPGEAIAGVPCCHSGGAMAFDQHGDLWIGVGDQADYRATNADRYRGDFQSDADKKHSGEWNAANTHSMLGSILRIHPDPGDPRGYTIPEGNFGDYFAEVYPARSDEFRDTSKVLAELYAKGTRNPYTITVDPVRRWVTWGECGPDGDVTTVISDDRHYGPTEEHNLLTHPGFMGWPYMSGPHIWHDVRQDPADPINDSPFNDGIELLPPIDEAIFYYERRCAMTGPIYRYDPDLDSDIKMPPHFHRQWLITDHNQRWVKSLTLDSAGTEVLYIEDVFPFVAGNSMRILDFDVGPDGALYINSYGHKHNTGPDVKLLRIEYTGDCLPTEVPWKLEKLGCMDSNFIGFDPAATHHNPKACQYVSIYAKERILAQDVDFQGRKVLITLRGDYEIGIMGLQGQMLYTATGHGEGVYVLPEKLNHGMYLLQVQAGDVSMKKKIVLF
jgi:glucose/arabinose dehydrogenase